MSLEEKYSSLAVYVGRLLGREYIDYLGKFRRMHKNELGEKYICLGRWGKCGAKYYFPTNQAKLSDMDSEELARMKEKDSCRRVADTFLVYRLTGVIRR